MSVRGSGLAGALCRIHLGKRTARRGGEEGEGEGEGGEMGAIVKERGTGEDGGPDQFSKRGFGPAETRVMRGACLRAGS